MLDENTVPQKGQLTNGIKNRFSENLSLLFFIINVNKPFEISIILAKIRVKTVSVIYGR